jgi:hypothetical protein
MDETLVSDLVAIIRRSPAGSGRLLAARLEGQLRAPPAAELEELARRAHSLAATDEEVALSLAALLATSSAERP